MATLEALTIGGQHDTKAAGISRVSSGAGLYELPWAAHASKSWKAHRSSVMATSHERGASYFAGLFVRRPREPQQP